MADKVDATVQTEPVIICNCRKRHVEDEKEYVSCKKSLSTVVLKMLIPNISVGAILGKRGEDIINAQQSSGAIAKISKVGEFYPGTNERICLISGDSKSVANFACFVTDKIISQYDQWNDSSQLNKKSQIKFLVSNAAAGVIIGKNGSYVQGIKEESGVFIQLSQKMESSLISERCVLLAGSSNQLQIAISKIVNAISQDTAFNSLSILNYVLNNSQTQIYQHTVWPTTINPETYQENYPSVIMAKPTAVPYNIDPNSSFATGYDHAYRSTSNKMERIEKSIEIPESIIGHVLGKRGSSIAELKTHTSTDIKISKKGVYAPNTTNRIVTIAGVCHNVEYAIKIITESLQNEEKRRSLADSTKSNGNFQK